MQKPSTYHLGIKACITNGKREILLLKRPHTKVQEKFFWDFPGGLNEQSESIETTLFREVREETGIGKIEILKFLHAFIVNPALISGPTQRILFIYHCKLLKKENIVLSSEHTGYELVPYKEAARRLAPKYPQEFLTQLPNLLGVETKKKRLITINNENTLKYET